jgi:hypothetical protein
MACVEFGSLCFTAGDDIVVDWQYLDADDNPVDLTGATITWQLLNSITDNTAVITMSGGITNAANGSGRWTLTDVQSQSLLPIGSESSSIEFISKIRIEFSDGTRKSVAGINLTINQGGVRP